MAYFKKALDAGEELGVETMAINSDGEKLEAVRRTLKTEYQSLGQTNETSVIRGPAIKKAGWLKSQ